MAGELNIFKHNVVEHHIPKADDLEAYYRIHAELCREYHAEIEYVLQQLDEIRKERIDFMENKIPQIRQKLAEEKISPEAIDDWCERLKDDVDRSFSASEDFLNTFIIAKRNEFERELKERLGKI